MKNATEVDKGKAGWWGEARETGEARRSPLKVIRRHDGLVCNAGFTFKSATCFKTNVTISATSCSFTLGRRLVGNMSTINFQKPSGVGFGCVSDSVLNLFLCWIYIWVCDLSKTNVAVSATNCLFTLGHRYCRQHVYDKFLETEWRRFRMWRRQCFQLLLAQTRISH